MLVGVLVHVRGQLTVDPGAGGAAAGRHFNPDAGPKDLTTPAVNRRARDSPVPVRDFQNKSQPCFISRFFLVIKLPKRRQLVVTVRFV